MSCGYFGCPLRLKNALYRLQRYILMKGNSDQVFLVLKVSMVWMSFCILDISNSIEKRLMTRTLYSNGWGIPDLLHIDYGRDGSNSLTFLTGASTFKFRMDISRKLSLETA